MNQLAAVVLASALVAACSQPPADEGAAPKTPVQAVRAKGGFGRDVVSAYGTVEASPDTVRTISAPFDGMVTRIPVVVGDQVGAASPVVVLTPTPAVEASLAKAAKDLSAARTQAAQAQRLFSENLATNADLATARQALGAAQAAADDLRKRVGKDGGRGLPAGLKGVVLTMAVQPGAAVATGAPLASVGGGGAIVAHIGLPAEQAMQVRRGDLASVTLLGGKTVLTGRITRVSAQLDPQTRLAAVLIALPPGAVAFGTAVQAEISVGAPRKLVWLPKAAIAANGAEPSVFVIDHGVAHQHVVELGQERGDQVAVRSGVNAGDVVVTIGAGTLQDGVAVTIQRAGP